eukprot:Gb_15483 [translate_table: standard]
MASLCILTIQMSGSERPTPGDNMIAYVCLTKHVHGCAYWTHLIGSHSCSQR